MGNSVSYVTRARTRARGAPGVGGVRKGPVGRFGRLRFQSLPSCTPSHSSGPGAMESTTCIILRDSAVMSITMPDSEAVEKKDLIASVRFAAAASLASAAFANACTWTIEPASFMAAKRSASRMSFFSTRSQSLSSIFSRHCKPRDAFKRFAAFLPVCTISITLELSASLEDWT